VLISTEDTLKRALQNPLQRRNSYVSVAPAEHAALQVTITASIVVLNVRKKDEVDVWRCFQPLGYTRSASVRNGME